MTPSTIDNPIRHLFIIGNGFDLAHNYPTSYNNFRDYLTDRFPGSDEYDELVPESTTMPDGEEKYDEDEIAGYVSRILDDCSGGDWGNLEAYLGSPVINSLVSDLDLLDPDDDSDKNLRHAYYNNVDRSTHMFATFPHVKDFFCDWIMDYYSGFNYGLNKLISRNKSIDWKSDIDEVLKEGDGFLDLNYTMTLEQVYGIDERNICHVHGKVGDCKEDIFLGHGEEDGEVEAFEILGAESNLTNLKRLLYKDTADAWNRHLDFFDRIGGDLVDIHSYGFSFSDVDLYYAERIAEIVDTAKVTWYINKFTDSERNSGTRKGRVLNEQIKKVEVLGFKVVADNRW
nr:AbiH family protein [uncultured Butyrivibrio sp.]